MGPEQFEERSTFLAEPLGSYQILDEVRVRPTPAQPSQGKLLLKKGK
jgi:hypothetical protein